MSHGLRRLRGARILQVQPSSPPLLTATAMTDWSRLLTEQRNPASEEMDELATLDLVRLINREDARVATAVEAVLPELIKPAPKWLTFVVNQRPAILY